MYEYIGHNHSQAAMISILELFETKIEGKVNYSNFVEFVRESGVSSGLEGLAKRLYTLISTSGPSRGMDLYIYLYICVNVYIYVSSGIEGYIHMFICIYIY
jgi:hypothetical protein